jgi:predicted lactoylglutathione lyase
MKQTTAFVQETDMTKMIFVNLPVKDLIAAIRFYEAIGCIRNEQFSDDRSACMVWSDTIFFQLLTHDRFADFAPRKIADAHEACGMLVALSFDSREAVDKVTEAAASAGGKADVRPPMDMGFMYGRTFEDPDGNVFEPLWMDMAAATQA